MNWINAADQAPKNKQVVLVFYDGYFYIGEYCKHDDNIFRLQNGKALWIDKQPGIYWTELTVPKGARNKHSVYSKPSFFK